MIAPIHATKSSPATTSDKPGERDEAALFSGATRNPCIDRRAWMAGPSPAAHQLRATEGERLLPCELCGLGIVLGAVRFKEPMVCA
jgi:hypothetical protein